MTILSKQSIKTIAVVKTVSATLLFAALMSAGQANAASQCKGLDNGACTKNNACGWVDGYERKDGRKVKSFCRTTNKTKAAKKS